ncbi:Zn-dependent hydrolase [Halobacillus massiliensis]|uniref:Zn-dependent hydrolase n=1 Tax=Halobacillus massiliensis TaxID=1926286 RepID=UPI0009E22E21|nr:Zn-dependent hydrolase [Halobacillus massiliensis]
MEKQQVLINGERLKETLEEFANFGRTDNNGVTRLSLSEVDLKARRHFQKCCEELGMSVAYDDMGNMYAVLSGQDDSLSPVVIGSHLDSVTKGGRFDGVLGVAAGLEAVRSIVDHDVKPKRPIVVVNFTNEEGARFEPSMMSSGVLSGKFDKEAMLQSTDSEGVPFEKALHESGFMGSEENRLKEAKAFLELHIEQGPILENESLKIGVVECVVGMACYEIEVSGESDHAGTTPMSMRKDALFAANDLIMDIRSKLNELPDDLVYTIGRMEVSPNIHTVIPNKAVFTLEARHQDMDIIKEVEHIAQSLEKSSGECQVNVRKLWGRETVWFEEKVVNQLEASADTLGYSYKKMVSGAGHDAQFIASYLPAAMVFVPSINGKSHSEDELTPWEDCEKGVNVILESALSLAND